MAMQQTNEKNFKRANSTENHKNQTSIEAQRTKQTAQTNRWDVNSWKREREGDRERQRNSSLLKSHRKTLLAEVFNDHGLLFLMLLLADCYFRFFFVCWLLTAASVFVLFFCCCRNLLVHLSSWMEYCVAVCAHFAIGELVLVLTVWWLSLLQRCCIKIKKLFALAFPGNFSFFRCLLCDDDFQIEAVSFGKNRCIESIVNR